MDNNNHIQDSHPVPGDESEAKLSARERYLNLIIRETKQVIAVYMAGVYRSLAFHEPGPEPNWWKNNSRTSSHIFWSPIQHKLPVELKKIILLGEPGSGKSIIAQASAYDFARFLLNDSKRRGLIFIVIRDLVPLLKEIEPDSSEVQYENEFLRAFKEHLNRFLGKECGDFKEELEALLVNGNCSLILDGWDEVPQKFQKHVYPGVNVLLKTYEFQYVFITCRKQSYDQRIELPGFSVVSTVPYDHGNIINSLNDISEYEVSLLPSAGLDEFLSSPFVLLDFAELYNKEPDFPIEWLQVVCEVTKIAIHRMHNEICLNKCLAGIFTDIAKLQRFLENLAFECHRYGFGLREAFRPSRQEMLDILETENSLDSRFLCEQFLDHIDQYSSIFTGFGGIPGETVFYGFLNREFQDYLTASYIVRISNNKLVFHELAEQGAEWDFVVKLALKMIAQTKNHPKALDDFAEWLCQLPGNEVRRQRLILWAGHLLSVVRALGIDEDIEPVIKNTQAEIISDFSIIATGRYLSVRERVEAGDALAILGDPRPEVTSIEEMMFCRIPAGEFLSSSFLNQTREFLPEFFISKFPITNAQFEHFINAGGYSNPTYWEYQIEKHHINRIIRRKKLYDYGLPFSLANHPVVGVSWYEALSFVQWLNEKFQQIKRFRVDNENDRIEFHERSFIKLPSELQWEKAARGTDGRKYPGGDEFHQEFGNTKEAGLHATSAVGSFPNGVSPYNVHDMSGNVWEWVTSRYDNLAQAGVNLEPQNKSILRGGSFFSRSSSAECAFRGAGDRLNVSRTIGFRVALITENKQNL